MIFLFEWKLVLALLLNICCSFHEYVWFVMYVLSCNHLKSVVLLKFLCHRKINMKNTPHSKLPSPKSPPLQSSKVCENHISYTFLQWMWQIWLHIILFFQNYFCERYHHCLQHRVFQASIIMLVTTMALWWDGLFKYTPP